MNADIVEEMNLYYSKNALHHDELMGYTTNEAWEDLLRPIICCFEEHVKNRDVLEVACGTGNWTQVLSKRAQSVLATDINRSVIDIARSKSYENDNVTFGIADAYRLEAVEGTFDAVFAADWWSHIPKSWIHRFLEGLIGKLRSGAGVVIIDMLPRPELDRMHSHYDEEGNRISKRSLPEGGVFHVVKNFPTESELLAVFEGVAEGVDYLEHDSLRRWMLKCTIK